MRRVEGESSAGAVKLEQKSMSARRPVLKPENVKLVRIARKTGVIDRLTPDTQRVLGLRYPEEGQSKKLREIGDQGGVTRQAVGLRLKRVSRRLREELRTEELGSEYRKGKSHFNMRYAIELWKKGMPLSGIAKKMGCSRYIVSSRLSGVYAEGRLRGRPKTRIDSETLTVLYDSGLSLGEMARRLRVSYDVVARRLRDEGIKIRRGRPRKK